MKSFHIWILVLALTIILVAKAGKSQQKRDADFSGVYVGEMDGLRAILEIDIDEDMLEGDVEVGDVEYTFEGSILGNQLTGQWYNDESENGIKFTATLKDDHLTIILHQSGGKRKLYFQRQTESDEQDVPETDIRVDGDRRLIGLWAKQEIISSGDASIATQVFLYLNGDGTFRYGDARTVGGGTNWSGGVSGSETTSGRWRTEGNFMQVMLTGTQQWLPFARFYVENNKLLLTGLDGSREIWYRQQ